MNYLAHAYLSFDIPEIVVGNLISDFVKGKKKLDYPTTIQTGIALHRAIDNFTDAHPATHKAKSFFKEDYRLYAGALVDVAFDHFLANDRQAFPSATALAGFSQQVYRQMDAWTTLFPEHFARMFPYMRSQDWLYNYRSKEGIFRSFAGLARRASYMPPPEKANQLFETHYQALNSCYTAFFPALKDFAGTTLNLLSQSGGNGKIE